MKQYAALFTADNAIEVQKMLNGMPGSQFNLDGAKYLAVEIVSTLLVHDHPGIDDQTFSVVVVLNVMPVGQPK